MSDPFEGMENWHKVTRATRPKIEMERSELAQKVIRSYAYGIAVLPWHKRLWNWIRGRFRFRTN